MKKAKLLLIMVALAVSSIATAQKGGILLYGDFGFNVSKETESFPGTPDDEMTTTTGTFSPGVGYYISDHLIVGLNIAIHSTSTENKDEDGTLENSTSSTGVGPFVRYIKHLGDIFEIRAQANTGVSFGKTQYENFDTGGSTIITNENKSGGFYFNIIPSIGANFGKGWALNFGFGLLGFDTNKTTPDNGNLGDDFETKNVNFGLNLNGSTLRWGVSKTFGGTPRNMK